MDGERGQEQEKWCVLELRFSDRRHSQKETSYEVEGREEDAI